VLRSKRKLIEEYVKSTGNPGVTPADHLEIAKEMANITTHRPRRGKSPDFVEALNPKPLLPGESQKPFVVEKGDSRSDPLTQHLAMRKIIRSKWVPQGQEHQLVGLEGNSLRRSST